MYGFYMGVLYFCIFMSQGIFDQLYLEECL